jgi:Flp pilus assembly protein TadD
MSQANEVTMKRIRGVLTVALAAMVMSTVGLASVTQTKKKTTSTSSPSVLQKVGSATSGFFKGVADTVTLKKFKSKTSSTKK